MKESLLLFLYRIFRYTSAWAGLFFLELPAAHPSQANQIIDITTRLLAALLFWDLMTSLFFLWLRKRTAQDASANGYGVAAMLLTLCTLFTLQACRAQMDHEQFLLLLGALGFRGMSSSSWVNNRGLIGMLASFTSHSLIAFLSFSLFYISGVPWQVIPLSIGFGGLLCSCESFRNGASINESPSRLSPPLFRIFTVLGPLIVTTAALVGFLERAYIVFLVGVFWGAHLGKQSTNQQPIPVGSNNTPLRLALLFTVGLIALRYIL